MAKFGKQDIGASNNSWGSNYTVANKAYACPEAGTLIKIYAYIRSGGATSAYVKAAIYTVSAGEPGAFVAGSAAVLVTSTFSWVEFSISADLTAQNYFLVLMSDSNGFQCKCTAGTAASYRSDDYPTFPNPFGTHNHDADTGDYSIYAEYTPSATAKGFSDVGGGSDAFLNPYRAMPFSETGHGAEAFSTPFRAMGFTDVGYGVDVFALLRQLAFSDVGHGTDVFALLRMLAFLDTGSGTDAFTKDILGAITKAFADAGLGSDAFTIPFKALRFSDVGAGADAFSKFITFLNKNFADTGLCSDAFAVLFKALGFSDVGHGVDLFTLLFTLAFLDTGSGADTFAKEITVITIRSKAVTLMGTKGVLSLLGNKGALILQGEKGSVELD